LPESAPNSNFAQPLTILDQTQRDIDSGVLIKRALLCRCPSCGEGKLYKSYLKQVDHCEACGAPWGEIRADDGPAWATIFIVGHILAPLIIIAMMFESIPDWALMITVAMLALGLCLLILPRTKAIFITLIWRTKCEGSTDNIVG
jgi:uncharacterized protein (DUF983 family)